MPPLGRFSTFTAQRGLRNVHDERIAGYAANILVSHVTAERSHAPKANPHRLRLAEK
jgi:hypothetical protein